MKRNEKDVRVCVGFILGGPSHSKQNAETKKVWLSRGVSREGAVSFSNLQ
jgi:hypothetical protein